MLKEKHRPPHIYRDNQIYFLTSRTYKEICYFNNDSKKEILKSVLIESTRRFNIKIYAWVIMDNHYHLLFDIRRKFRNAQFANPEESDLRNSEMNGVNFALAVERKFPFRLSASSADKFSGQASQFANHGGDELKYKEVEREEFVSKLRISEMTPKGNFASKYQIVEFIRKLHKDSSRILNKIDNTSGRKIWYQYWDHCIRDEEDFYKHFNYIHNNPIKQKKVKNIEELYLYKYSSFNTWIKKKGREWINFCFSDYPILDYSEDV